MTTSYVMCRVPLCSTNSPKFLNGEDSCECRWHNMLDLESITMPKSKEKKK